MTPADLRVSCESLNGERGTGGQTRLARLLHRDYSAVWGKLDGKSRVFCPFSDVAGDNAWMGWLIR